MYAPSTPCPVWMLGPCWAPAVVGLQALLHPLLCLELVLILAACSAARAALGHTQSGVCGEGVGGNSRSPSFCFSSPCRAWLCLRTPFCSPVKQLQLSWLPGWLGEGVSPTQRVLPGLALQSQRWSLAYSCQGSVAGAGALPCCGASPAWGFERQVTPSSVLHSHQTASVFLWHVCCTG